MQTIVDHLLTHYEIINPKSKNPIVFLPGWAHTTSHWLDFLRNLPPSHTYIVLDLPGFGATQPLSSNPNVPDYTTFIHHFTRKLKLTDFSLFGHSFGGQIALDYATKFPLVHLYLLSPAGIRTQSTKIKIRTNLTNLLKPITKALPSPLKTKIISLLASPDYANSNSYQQNLLKNILHYDLTTSLSSIKIETDLFWGSEDRAIPYTGKIYANSMPNCSLHILYSAGHSPHLTHKDKLTLKLTKILNLKS